MYVKDKELIMTAQIENEYEEQKHYWLAAVVISFVAPTGEAMDTNVNAIINNPVGGYVSKKMLANAQIQAQIQLSNSLDGKLPEVKGVYIQSLNYIGYMTESDFHGTETDDGQ